MKCSLGSGDADSAASSDAGLVGRSDVDAATSSNTAPLDRNTALLDVEIAGVAGSLVELQAGDLFVALPFADGDAHGHVEEALATGAVLALVSETWGGLGSLTPEMRARCATTPDVLGSFRRLAAALRRELPCPVAAVFGCNGKTTTKEMLAALLGSPGRRIVKTPGTDNGFVGLPRTLCGRAIQRASPPDAVVLEIGIDALFAMEEHARLTVPDLVVLTALGPEHLDGLGDTASAVAQELCLLDEVPAATRVLPWGDPEVLRVPGIVRTQDITVLEEDLWIAGRVDWPPSSRTLLFRTTLKGEGSAVVARWMVAGERASPAWEGHFDVPLPGAHNARNFALALAAALALGRAPEEIAQGWATFEPPPWRSRITPLARGALLYDDSFNASPLGVKAALTALADPSWAHRPKVIVLGDMLELGPESERWHVELASLVTSLQGPSLHLFGPHMGALARALAARGHGEMVRRAIEDASRDPVDLVADLDLPPGAVVLVKGSRAMHMDRVVRYLQLRWGLAPAASAQLLGGVTSVLVTGSSGATAAAQLIATTLRRQGIPVGRLDASGMFLEERPIVPALHVDPRTDLLQRCVAADIPFAVMEIAHHDIQASVATIPVTVAVLTSFSDADLPEGGDAERHLAEKAQLFLRAQGLQAAVLPADDPGGDLLAEVIPPGVRVLRFGARAAMAACLVALVLGRSSQSASTSLC